MKNVSIPLSLNGFYFHNRLVFKANQSLFFLLKHLYLLIKTRTVKNVFLFLALGLFYFNGSAQCDRERDSLALVALYHATDGPNWFIQWEFTNPMDVWSGITLNDNGCIEEIRLPYFGLDGILPDEICQLTDLVWFELNDNRIYQPFPSCLGNLTSLKKLFLDSALEDAKIPDEILQISSLTDLSLTGNYINSPIPEGIASLVNLEDLFAGNNYFTEPVPSGISNLVHLKRAFLGANNFTLFPIEFTLLDSLTTLDLSSNDIEEIPDQVQQFKSLKKLDLDWNKINFISPDIGNVSSLVELSLANNELTEIPVTITNLENLTILDLENNDFSQEWPMAVFRIPNLRTLNLNHCSLDGPIPEKLYGMSTLTTLRLSNNNIIDTISSEIGNLTQLEDLVLWDNKFYGNIPQQLIELRRLQFVYLFKNSFEGTLPDFTHSNLFELLLNENNFSGCIPYSYCDIVRANLNNNPLLPWEGIIDPFCEDEQEQIGAPCDDGDPNTSNEQINDDCECAAPSNNDELSSLNLIVYPNPFKEKILIDVLSDVVQRMEIYNHLGQLVYDQKIIRGNNEVFLEELLSGIYFLKVDGYFKQILIKT